MIRVRTHVILMMVRNDSRHTYHQLYTNIFTPEKIRLRIKLPIQHIDSSSYPFFLKELCKDKGIILVHVY